MLEAGLFKDADAVIGWHPQDITTASFQYSKAVASLRFKFKGVAAHSSSARVLWWGRCFLSPPIGDGYRR